MKTVWAKDRLEEWNTRLFFQYKVKKASSIALVALDYYNIYIDGHFIGHGPARAARGYIRKDVYDLSDFENFVVTVEVLCWNIHTFCLATRQPLFGAEIYSGTEKIADTDDFIAFEVGDYVRKVQKSSYQRGFSEMYVLSQDRTAFYRGKEVFTPVETEETPCPKVLERGVKFPSYELCKGQNIQNGQILIDTSAWLWEDVQMTNNYCNDAFDKSEIAEFVSDTVCQFIFQKDDKVTNRLTALQYALYDFEKVVFGQHVIKLCVEEDAELYVTWSQDVSADEQAWRFPFYRDSCCDIVKFTLKRGEYTLRTFLPYSFKYTALVCKSGRVRIDEYGVSTIGNADAFQLKFLCENKNLERIVQASQNGFAHNAIDIFTDCPSRESAGYLCDAFFSGRAERLLTGDNLVEKNFLENYIMAESFPGYQKGMVPMCYPSNIKKHSFIPNWALWFIVELKDYRLRTGDSALVEKAKERVYGILRWFDDYVNPEGFLEKLNGWIFVEWSDANDYLQDVNIPTNILYAAALEIAGELYIDERLIAQSCALREKIVAYSFDGLFFEDNLVRNENGDLKRAGNISETCQYYALFFHLADGSHFAQYRKRLIEDFGCVRDVENVYPSICKSNMFIGDYLRLSYLCEIGEYERVLEESETLFTHMAEKTLTIWEYETVLNSLDHGFASCASCFILESIEKTRKYEYQIIRS